MKTLKSAEFHAARVQLWQRPSFVRHRDSLERSAITWRPHTKHDHYRVSAEIEMDRAFGLTFGNRFYHAEPYDNV